jgi:hypothetical protein
MAVCGKAEKRYSDAHLIICITSDAADIIKTDIPFRLILPILEQYNNDAGDDAGVVSLIASVAGAISASMIIIERDESEIVVAFFM